MALDEKLIISICQLNKVMWEDCFGIIICCSHYKAVTICYAYGFQKIAAFSVIRGNQNKGIQEVELK